MTFLAQCLFGLTWSDFPETAFCWWATACSGVFLDVNAAARFSSAGSWALCTPSTSDKWDVCLVFGTSTRVPGVWSPGGSLSGVGLLARDCLCWIWKAHSYSHSLNQDWAAWFGSEKISASRVRNPDSYLSTFRASRLEEDLNAE